MPEELPFRTKPQIGIELLQRTRRHGLVKFDWLIADEFYGHNGAFLEQLEQMGQRYVVEVPSNTTVWTVDPQTQVPAHEGRRGPVATRPPRDRARQHVRSVRALAENLPPAAWQMLQLRAGAKGPLAFAFARLRVWAVRHRQPGPACWLLVRRSLEPDGELKYYLSNAAPDEPLQTMALVTGTRYSVEQFLGEGKAYLGMAQYEARAWSSWHHHISLVALAHLLVTLTRQRFKKNSRADLGHGATLAQKRLASTSINARGRDRDRPLPSETKPCGPNLAHKSVASTPQKDQVQSAAVELEEIAHWAASSADERTSADYSPEFLGFISGIIGTKVEKAPKPRVRDGRDYQSVLFQQLWKLVEADICGRRSTQA